MSIQSITKKRVAAAVVTLSIGGTGLAMSGYGIESSTQVRAGKAGKAGEQQAATVTAAPDDAINGARVRLVARRTGLGRFTLGRAASASGWGSATGSAVTNEVATAIDNAHDQAARPHGMRVPRRVKITLPSYEGGRPPSAAAPSVEGGTAPSVEPGWTTTIDLGEAPNVGTPSIDPGSSGTLHRPTVAVS